MSSEQLEHGAEGGMAREEFERLKRYVGFDAETARWLRLLHPLAQPHFESIAVDFYDAIEHDDTVSGLILGGSLQIQRLQRTLVRWMDSALLGPHDETYLATRSRIGHVHVRISLPQHYMLGAMNRIRRRLGALVDGLEDPAHRTHVRDALETLLDLELAIMLDSYRLHLQERLRGSERLATIGQLAASIGHELRNPLGIIESSVYLSRQKLSRGEVGAVERHLDKIGVQVKVCNTTITELLELARSRPPRKQERSVGSIIAAAVESIVLDEGITLEGHGTEQLVFADPDQLRQVLANLFVNAQQAMDGRGRLVVTASSDDAGCSLLVSDDGPGVPPEHVERIFDALYTTRSSGTGLGLALCRRILDAHGGEITLVPTPRGASFRVWLPAAPRD